ncbi:Aste57867_3983 [Aphanomyces stellatus]|uniref:Aste57867_3983 protein n=1 Tax=Aphanomyces stellatus TaxID=120398 RepID=A0A485KBZ2_9STRA|nr:hypothetical protein As57867_003972 [Aphanomyces stellatus]VFT81120.1 Aste57867_3983 [Aphanomyces stellatus]
MADSTIMGDVEDMEPVFMDKKAKRRLYDRKKQKKKLAEVKMLQNLIQDLSVKAGELKYFKQSMLPWKDIAISLGRESADAYDANRMLRGELFQVENLAMEMGKWVVAMQSPPVPHAPKIQHTCWRYTSLPKSDAARLMGFDWITQHLYHNIDRFVDQCRFPSHFERHFSIHAEFVDDTHLVDQCAQRVEPVSLDVAASILHNTIFQYPGHDKVLETPGADMHYVRYKAAVGQDFFFENTLMREFRDAKRYIIVVHVISDDDKHPNVGVRRDWTQWYMAEAVDATHTVIREGMRWYGLRTAKRCLSIEESTAKYGPLLASLPTEEAKLAKYEAYLQSNMQIEFEKDCGDFRNLMAQHNPSV